jgi:uncharacterized coiled-coil DUF342 family protein
MLAQRDAALARMREMETAAAVACARRDELADKLAESKQAWDAAEQRYHDAKTECDDLRALADRLAEALRELRQHTLENRTLRAINAALADYEATRK